MSKTMPKNNHSTGKNTRIKKITVRGKMYYETKVGVAKTKNEAKRWLNYIKIDRS
jgi:hypothetical protein